MFACRTLSCLSHLRDASNTPDAISQLLPLSYPTPSFLKTPPGMCPSQWSRICSCFGIVRNAHLAFSPQCLGPMKMFMLKHTAMMQQP